MAFQHERLSHAYLLIGPTGAGKEATAIELAKYVLAGSTSVETNRRLAGLSHPDLHIIFPAPAKVKETEYRGIIDSLAENAYYRQTPWANPAISIERIRDIRRKAAYKSYEGNGRVILIFDCERMTTEGANALLKILEEPPDGMYLIMTSSRPTLLLPTISSRCQVVKFDPLSSDLIEDELVKAGNPPSNAKIVSRLSNGSYRGALDLLSEDLQEMQEVALEFFRKTVQQSYAQALFVEQLLQRFQKDTKSIREVLAYVAIWFRDVLINRESGGLESPFLAHPEEQNVLKNFTNSFPNADLNAAVNEIEKSLELMDRNVQVNLILIVLLNKLRAHVRG